MKILAILGPRSRPRDVALFQPQFAELTVLETPADQVVKETLIGAELALVFGGDGTLHRHLNALVAAKTPTLVVPSGSGNDFAVVNGIRSATVAAELFAEFLQGKAQPRNADLGLVRTADGQSHHFSCCANVGLDADATRRANALPAWIKARIGYLLGGLSAVVNYQPQRLLVTRGDEIMLAEKGWFVAVSNTPIYGGGLPIAPQASIWDGELDVTCLRKTPRWNVIRHYPKILSGTHVRLPVITAFRTQQLRIETETPQDVYSDGDYVGSTPCDITIAPGALRVLTRAGR